VDYGEQKMLKGSNSNQSSPDSQKYTSETEKSTWINVVVCNEASCKEQLMQELGNFYRQHADLSVGKIA
jgi:ABC-type metal ion transport system substrate-binding protein